MARFDSEGIAEQITRWVSCESPSRDAAAVNQMQDIVEADLAAPGIAVERLPAGEGAADVVIARAGPANNQPPVLVLSHVDTVHPIGTIERDLPLCREGERLYGPGALDMKGGAVMGLVAFRAAVADDALRRPVIYMFTPDEEIGAIHTRGLIEEMAEGVSHVLVTEPARPGGRVVTARRGSGRYDVYLRGIPAHSGSGQEIGRSAIREAAHQILRIEGAADPDRGISVTVGLIKGGTASNTIPEHAWFNVDFRITHPEDADRMDAFIRGLEPVDRDVAITVEGCITRPPYGKSPGIAELHGRVQEIGAELGLPLEELPLAGGGSDGNFTAAMGIPTIDGLGIEGAGAHTLEEHAIITSVGQRTELMYRLLTRL